MLMRDSPCMSEFLCFQLPPLNVRATAFFGILLCCTELRRRLSLVFRCVQEIAAADAFLLRQLDCSTLLNVLPSATHLTSTFPLAWGQWWSCSGRLHVMTLPTNLMNIDVLGSWDWSGNTAIGPRNVDAFELIQWLTSGSTRYLNKQV